jgi:vancomycin resistance protein VanW
MRRRLKRRIRLFLRQLADIAGGTAFRWAKHKTSDLQAFPYTIEVVQAIMPTALLDNKIHNINLAIRQFHLLQWEPGTVLSFWHLVGEASQQRGYREGRNIVAGKLQKDFGGGLCQLSGILYHLALLANLKVVERHHHSMDIYREEERFTPLGSDATVVYGYKDLRLENNLAVPLVLWLQVTETALTARLHTAQALSPQALVFERQYSDSSVTVRALAGADGRLVGISHYALAEEKHG